MVRRGPSTGATAATTAAEDAAGATLTATLLPLRAAVVAAWLLARAAATAVGVLTEVLAGGFGACTRAGGGRARVGCRALPHRIDRLGRARVSVRYRTFRTAVHLRGREGARAGCNVAHPHVGENEYLLSPADFAFLTFAHSWRLCAVRVPYALRHRHTDWLSADLATGDVMSSARPEGTHHGE